MTRSAVYNCSKCEKYGKNRICLLDSEALPYNEVVPIVVDDRVTNDGEIVEIRDIDQFLDILAELKLVIGSSVFSIVLTYFKQVCPASLIKSTLSIFLDMEHRAKVYKSLPYDGSMGDQPNLVVEAFDVIGVARAEFERDRLVEMKKPAKTGVTSRGSKR